MAITACSKTVQWEEEVPLNTGETIVVKRSGVYTYRGLTSDGSHFRYVPEWRSTIEFTYKGIQYSYTGEASIQLLAIAPNGMPNLVADARGWGNRNKYPCVTPYYVQLKPVETGKQWTWPSQVEQWLFNLPTNLSIGLVPLDHDGVMVRAADRKRLNGSILIYTHYQRIDPATKPENCMEIN